MASPPSLWGLSSRNNNAGYEGDLELALIPEEFLKDILHEEEDENGVLLENANTTFDRFALLFEFTGDDHAIRHVFYCCSASRPSQEGDTKEDEKEVKTEELSLIASALANGYVKAKSSVNTTKAVYDAWYDAVYMPPAAASEEEEEQGGETEPSNGETEPQG